MVRTYVRRFNVQEHDADDLVQDVFARLREELPRFRLDHAKGRFRGWLRRVTDNTVRDWLRAAARAQRLPRELVERFVADDDAKDRRRRDEWRRAVLDTVVARVRGEYQGAGDAARHRTFACFEMATLQNRPAKEVAAALGIDAVNNVHVYAHRVLQRVRELCLEYDEDFD